MDCTNLVARIGVLRAIVSTNILINVVLRYLLGVLLSIAMTVSVSQAQSTSAELPAIRPFPFPYRAMVAIAPDADSMSIAAYRNIYRFIRTHEETAMGPGLGLDIADSFWIAGDDNRSIALNDKAFNKRQDFEEIVAYIRAGWIDTLHSYGDYDEEKYYFTRKDGIKALDILRDKNLQIRIWSNHGGENNTQNLGGAMQYQKGDRPATLAYHADVLLDAGFQFFWDPTFPNQNEAMPSVIRPLTLQDGQRVWGFARMSSKMDDIGYCKPNDAGVIPRRCWKQGEHSYFWIWHPDNLGNALTHQKLTEIVEKNLFLIVAQHLGTYLMPDRVTLPSGAIQSLRELRDLQNAGQILVARTSRLLDYNRSRDYINYAVYKSSDRMQINIISIADPVFGSFRPSIDNVRGLTFYVSDPEKTDVRVNGEPINATDVTRNPSDGVAPSIGIRWYPDDFKDYTMKFQQLDLDRGSKP